MAITSYSSSRVGNVTTVVVVSDLTPPIWYYWYLDGDFVGSGTASSRAFVINAGEQVEIVVVDSDSPSEDVVAIAPESHPPRRTLAWCRSAADTYQYVVEQRKNAASWVEIARVFSDSNRWLYTVQTARLTDLASYEWRVTPYDEGGDAGTSVSITAETIVRVPDAPQFTATFNDSTDKVTFAAA